MVSRFRVFPCGHMREVTDMRVVCEHVVVVPRGNFLDIPPLDRALPAWL